VYLLPEGITIASDHVILDGQGATITGMDRKGQGIKVLGRKNVVIKNLHITNFYHGISIERSTRIAVQNCMVTATAELRPNTLFLNIWEPAADAYGAAIFLHDVTDARIHENDLQHQMNGILSYQCKRLEVVNNLASYCSGFGFHLFETCESTFTGNYADFCCRFHLSNTGSHLGADAAGFLIVFKSCNNIFRKNYARLGGDGFFLAGLTPDGSDVGCNHNLFEENDASYSPNNAFEGVFSKGNVYRGNKANHSNYGFWLGFSSECTVRANQILNNRQAGIAVENGMHFEIMENDIQSNFHGLLVWTRLYESLKKVPGVNQTSHDWLIKGNRFIGNQKGIRIAANQNHGVQPLDNEMSSIAPGSHVIWNNELLENMIGIELEKVEGADLRQNILSNRIANLEEK